MVGKCILVEAGWGGRAIASIRSGGAGGIRPSRRAAISRTGWSRFQRALPQDRRPPCLAAPTMWPLPGKAAFACMAKLLAFELASMIYVVGNASKGSVACPKAGSGAVSCSARRLRWSKFAFVAPFSTPWSLGREERPGALRVGMVLMGSTGPDSRPRRGDKRKF